MDANGSVERAMCQLLFACFSDAGKMISATSHLVKIVRALCNSVSVEARSSTRTKLSNVVSLAKEVTEIQAPEEKLPLLEDIARSCKDLLEEVERLREAHPSAGTALSATSSPSSSSQSLTLDPTQNRVMSYRRNPPPFLAPDEAEEDKELAAIAAAAVTSHPSTEPDDDLSKVSGQLKAGLLQLHDATKKWEVNGVVSNATQVVKTLPVLLKCAEKIPPADIAAQRRDLLAACSGVTNIARAVAKVPSNKDPQPRLLSSIRTLEEAVAAFCVTVRKLMAPPPSPGTFAQEQMCDWDSLKAKLRNVETKKATYNFTSEELDDLLESSTHELRTNLYRLEGLFEDNGVSLASHPEDQSEVCLHIERTVFAVCQLIEVCDFLLPTAPMREPTLTFSITLVNCAQTFFNGGCASPQSLQALRNTMQALVKASGELETSCEGACDQNEEQVLEKPPASSTLSISIDMRTDEGFDLIYQKPIANGSLVQLEIDPAADVKALKLLAAKRCDIKLAGILLCHPHHGELVDSTLLSEFDVTSEPLTLYSKSSTQTEVAAEPSVGYKNVKDGAQRESVKNRYSGQLSVENLLDHTDSPAALDPKTTTIASMAARNTFKSSTAFGTVDVLKQGSLTKEGKTVKSWKTRWFVLTTEELSYFKSKNEKSPLGVAVLSEYKECRPMPERGSCCFSLIPKSSKGRTFYICSASDEDLTEWVNAIDGAIPGRRTREEKLSDIQDCIGYLMQRGITKEGIFRVPGNAGKVKKMIVEFEGNGKVDLEKVLNPHTLASFLRKVLKEEMIDPLIPVNAQEALARNMADGADIATCLKATIDTIADQDRTVLRALMRLFTHISANFEQTKMSYVDLASSFGTAIFTAMYEDQGVQCLEVMIEQCSYIIGSL